MDTTSSISAYHIPCNHRSLFKPHLVELIFKWSSWSKTVASVGTMTNEPLVDELFWDDMDTTTLKSD